MIMEPLLVILEDTYHIVKNRRKLDKIRR
jgi:hypothetical protein